MKTILCIVTFIIIAIPFNGIADDEKPIKTLSTIQPNQPYEELGLVAFYQGKETSMFGSDAVATLNAAVETLQEKVEEFEADMIIGVSFIPITTGDPGMIVTGTAIKFIK